MAKAVARAVSVEPFQAMATVSPRRDGGVGGAIRIGRPLSNSTASRVATSSLASRWLPAAWTARTLQRGSRRAAAASSRAARRQLAREQGLRLRNVEAGQPRSVTAFQPIAAGRPSDGDDRDACFREGLGVALDRSLGDLELFGELLRGQLPSGLQDHQERNEAACPHVPKEYFINTTEGGGNAR